MRRSFNASLCPKSPPPNKGRGEWGSVIGSPFNQWFREMLDSNKIKSKDFHELIKIPYGTVIAWRSNNDPHIWGACKIARGFESLGLGEFEEIKAKIKALKRSK